MLALREDGYLYCDPTETHTNTLRVQVPAAPSFGLKTEHSILFNHTNVSRPEAEAGCVKDGDVDPGRRKTMTLISAQSVCEAREILTWNQLNHIY